MKYLLDLNSISTDRKCQVKTLHTTIIGDAADMSDISSETIDLVVTSPPYPMIRMWDDLFCRQESSIRNHLDAHEGMVAFELMHNELDKVWDEIFRVLKTGGFACVNIGDATRKLGDDFCLYPNHARILHNSSNHRPQRYTRSHSRMCLANLPATHKGCPDCRFAISAR